ncbi:MAG: hypothetical protein IJM64_10120 [Ottowia sp.]|nr:hypothetical protein [Ottowia sp.]
MPHVNRGSTEPEFVACLQKFARHTSHVVTSPVRVHTRAAAAAAFFLHHTFSGAFMGAQTPGIIRHYPALSGIIRHYPALSGIIRHYPAL